MKIQRNTLILLVAGSLAWACQAHAEPGATSPQGQALEGGDGASPGTDEAWARDALGNALESLGYKADVRSRRAFRKGPDPDAGETGKITQTQSQSKSTRQSNSQSERVAKEGTRSADALSGALDSPSSKCSIKSGIFPKVPKAGGSISHWEGKEMGAVRLEADKLAGVADRKAVASGYVVLQRDGNTVNANLLSYDIQNGRLSVPDGFVLSTPMGDVEGTSLEYDFDDKAGATGKVTFASDVDGKRIQGVAESLRIEDDNYVAMDGAMANTCVTGDDSWYFKAGVIEADMKREVGVARNATLFFKGIPILYSPWIDFPLGKSRKSGFLTPTLGFGSYGAEIEIPYYLNLAPNRDATIALRYYGKRGPRIKAQYRYLGDGHRGRIEGSVITRDRMMNNKARGDFYWIHEGFERNGFSYGWDLRDASDDNWFLDFYDREAAASNVNLNREIWGAWNGLFAKGGLSALLRVRSFKTLDIDGAHHISPHAELPSLEIRYGVDLIKDSRLRFDLDAGVAYFHKKNAVSGARILARPSLSLNFEKPWGWLKLKSSYSWAGYNLRNPKDDGSGSSVLAVPTTRPGVFATSFNEGFFSRGAPNLNLDAGLVFERKFDFLGDKYYQTLEPRIFYDFTPEMDLRAAPGFDSDVRSLTYRDLFRQGPWGGGDGADPVNRISMAVQSSISEAGTGEEVLRMGIGHRYDLGKGRKSDIVGFIRNRIFRHVDYAMEWHYDSGIERTTLVNAAFQFHPEQGKMINLGYNFDRNLKNADSDKNRYGQLSAAFQWPLSDHLSVALRTDFALADMKVQDMFGGLSYTSPCGCWSMGLYGRKFFTFEHKDKGAVYIKIQLKDIGRSGIDKEPVMDMLVPGGQER